MTGPELFRLERRGYMHPATLIHPNGSRASVMGPKRLRHHMARLVLDAWGVPADWEAARRTRAMRRGR